MSDTCAKSTQVMKLTDYLNQLNMLDRDPTDSQPRLTLGLKSADSRTEHVFPIETNRTEDWLLVGASCLIRMQRLSCLLVSLTEQIPFGDCLCVCVFAPVPQTKFVN